MISYIIKKAVTVLMKKPFMLWGVSLLSGIITGAVNGACWAVPFLAIPIVVTLNAGMSALYLDGYNGIEVNSKQLFRGFSKECISRVPGGMLWHKLWSSIWAFVPIVGTIKAYSYAFTPYILLTRPEISTLDALKVSMKETDGYKLKMFGADLLMGLILCGVILVFALIMIIPVIGTLVGFVGIIAAIVLYPLFTGLVRAGFYEEAKSGKFTYLMDTSVTGASVNDRTNWYCTQCGTQQNATNAFCTSCGAPKSK